MRRVLLTFLSIALAAPCAWAEEKPKETGEAAAMSQAAAKQEVPTIRIYGMVNIGAERWPVPRARVSLPGQTVLADNEGRFVFEKVPQVRQTDLNVRILDEKNDVIGCSSVPLQVDHVAIAAEGAQGFTVEVLSTRQDMEVELKLVSPKGTAVNEYCSTCHLPNPCASELDKAPSWDSVEHLGGVGVPLAELEDFKNKITAEGVDPTLIRNLRYRDIHPHERDMTTLLRTKQDYRRPSALPIGDPIELNCLVCHTSHEETDAQSFLRLEFVENNTLCKQCHK